MRKDVIYLYPDDRFYQGIKEMNLKSKSRLQKFTRTRSNLFNLHYFYTTEPTIHQTLLTPSNNKEWYKTDKKGCISVLEIKTPIVPSFLVVQVIGFPLKYSLRDRIECMPNGMYSFSFKNKEEEKLDSSVNTWISSTIYNLKCGKTSEATKEHLSSSVVRQMKYICDRKNELQLNLTVCVLHPIYFFHGYKSMFTLKVFAPTINRILKSNMKVGVIKVRSFLHKYKYVKMSPLRKRRLTLVFIQYATKYVRDPMIFYNMFHFLHRIYIVQKPF